jgi:hypothetical protein
MKHYLKRQEEIKRREVAPPPTASVRVVPEPPSYKLALALHEILNDMDIKVSKTTNTRKNLGKTCSLLIAEQLIKKGLINDQALCSI